jgi:hypothetical protein
MQAEVQGKTYKVWGLDNAIHGPVELPVLVDWAQEGRVAPSTWVFAEQEDVWRKAVDVPELRLFFTQTTTPRPPAVGSPGCVLRDLKPGALRRVKILAHLSEGQLALLLNFVEVQEAPVGSTVVKQGDHGDAMYMVLTGELRVKITAGGRQTILATLGTGDFFGEISMIDAGPRSADVVANQTSILLKISAAAFQRLMRESPAVAASLLLATCRTLTARIRADNKRYADSVAIFRAIQ